MAKLTRSSAAACIALMLSGCGVQMPRVTPAPVPEPERTPPALTFLHTDGRLIVNETGESVQLRGVNIGGWLLLEPWIPGLDNQENVETEKELWDLMGRRFGNDAKLSLIKTYRDTFFDEDDVRRIAEMGLNCLRVPVWWRAVSDPEYGGDITYLDRCIEWCARYGVYVVIDLQGAPGCQAKESANVGEPANGGALWANPAFKDQTVQWWKEIAARYKDEPAVAAYDLLNEGTARPQHSDLVGLYDRLYREIRAIDPRHVIVFEDVWGFHLLPRPEEMGWTNCVYSFHYYPQTMTEGIEADAVTLPRFNRTALHLGVPIYVGEFNPIMAERGGVDSFLKYREVCEYFGWAWTFWTYKKIEGNDNITWGLYGYVADLPAPDLNNDPIEKIQGYFEAIATSNTAMHPLIPAALRAPSRWEPEKAGGDGVIPLSLREATVMTGEKGFLRYEWGCTPPSIGYWSAGDTVGWRVHAPADGVYELVLRLANNSDRNVARVWVDGVHVAAAPVQNTQGFRKYADRTLCRIELPKGGHTIEIGQADSEKGFINLQRGWLRSVAGDAAQPDEHALWLRPFNATGLPAGSPIRTEWLNNPPNSASWSAGEKVSWRVVLRKGGRYAVRAAYATPNADTTLDVQVDGKAVVRKALPATRDWQTYAEHELGALDLAPGEHSITLRWNVPHPTAAGNLRDLLFVRSPQP